ncbi:hypothetical protein HDV06_001676 [Boothiomyces sp. JEL0866]|nr:hypothetical protein HDV06_001676 [Boothiomyces sp. JEL0866]
MADERPVSAIPKSTTLLQDIGGEAAIDKIVKKLYENLLKDPTLSHFFENTDMEIQHKMQKKFLMHIMTGEPRLKAHAPMNLKDEHFDIIKATIGDTMGELGIAKPLIIEVMRICENNRNDVLGKDDPPKTSEIHTKIGGDKGLDEIIEKFYDLVLQDDFLAPYFVRMNISQQKRVMKSYMNYLFLGTPYNAKKMKTAHSKLQLNDSHFNKVKELLFMSMEQLNVDHESIDQFLIICEKTRSDVLGYNDPNAAEIVSLPSKDSLHGSKHSLNDH